MSACNGPPVVRTLSGMVAMAGEAEKEVEDGKHKKVKEQLVLMDVRDGYAHIAFVWVFYGVKYLFL